MTVLAISKWSVIVCEMDISVTKCKQRCLAIICRVERTGGEVTITRRGRVGAQLLGRGFPRETADLRPWERLRAAGGQLLAAPNESVARETDFEALR